MADRSYHPSLKPDINIILTHFNVFDDDWYVLNDKELVIPCPRCKKGEEHFSVNIRTKKYLCFKCGYRGEIKADTPEAVIDTDTKMKTSIELLTGVFQKKIQPLKWFDLSETVDARFWDESAEYLNKRGFSEEMIEFYNIRWHFRWNRVVVPNRLSEKLKTDMYVARDVSGKSSRKYINPSGSNSKRVIFNLHNVVGQFDDVIISEGVFSAMSSGYNGVATYGKSVSREQLDILDKCNFEKYYISAESDAINYAMDLADKLRNRGKKVYIIEMPEGKDANDLTREEFLIMLAKTKKYESKFQIQSMFDLTRKIEKKDFKLAKNLTDSFRKLMLV